MSYGKSQKFAKKNNLSLKLIQSISYLSKAYLSEKFYWVYNQLKKEEAFYAYTQPKSQVNA